MSSVTLSQEIAKKLIVDIVSGALGPGTRLDEQSIAKRFKVSRTPVRDALRHLAASRLVEFAPRRGFSVSSIDRGKLQDAYEAFSEIEALCARLCALRAGITERARLEAIHGEATILARKPDYEKYALINDAFHDTIYAGAHNDTLRNIARDLRQQLLPFRSRVFFEIENSQAEHRALLDAILAKDADGAAAAMLRHTSRAALLVLNHITGTGPAASTTVQKRGSLKDNDHNRPAPPKPRTRNTKVRTGSSKRSRP